MGQTFATFGLLGGIISGIIAINYCANKGWTTEIRKVKDMPRRFASAWFREECAP
ncbi:MAG: hypothetical protein ACLUE1_01970 [Adlercreutzia equolifaciens]